MVTVILKHSVIKKARSKVFVTVAFSGLFSYPSRYNPSQKRDARCTNIPQKGALLTVKGVGQRRRKGFQEWYRLLQQQGQGVEDEGRFVVGLSLNWILGNPAHPESPFSAVEIRHPARNTRL